MSRSFIVYILAAFGIVIFVTFGIPMIDFNSESDPHSEVYFIDGILSEKKEIIIGQFSPIIGNDDLGDDEIHFVETVTQNRGVYRKGNLFVLSLKGESENQSIEFVKQEITNDEILIFVKRVQDVKGTNILLGRMFLSEYIPYSFIDIDTHSVLL